MVPLAHRAEGRARDPPVMEKFLIKLSLSLSLSRPFELESGRGQGVYSGALAPGRQY